MTLLPNGNRRRAWLLFAVLWLAACAYWYLEPIRYSRLEAAEQKRTLDAESRSRQFDICLAKNNLTWAALDATHRAECSRQASEQCRGGGLLCNVEYWRDFCIRMQAVPCRDIGSLIEGDGSPPIFAALSHTDALQLKYAAYY